MGLILSILVFLYKSMRPKVVDLSLGTDKVLHDCVASGLEECRYIDVVRFDGPLFFANASYLEDQIRNRRRTKKELKHIVISASGINEIDISFSGVNRSVLNVLKRTHLIVKIGVDHIYPTVEEAISAVHDETHMGGEEKNCPLNTVCKLS
jgi:MFS superfamily sulfate permease-like transporter